MKRLVVVSYAINGRGLGHLTRQLAILRWIRRYGAVLGHRVEPWILTSSEADTLARREGVPALKIPSKAMMRDADLDPARYLSIARTWVLNAIAGLQPDLLLVDTFPAGSFGELVAALELASRRVLVARSVRDEVGSEQVYQALLPLYQQVVVPEVGGTGPILLCEREELLDRAAARRALGVPDGKRAVYVSLGGGGDPAVAGALPRLVDRLVARGDHVIVGAGPLYQGEERRGDGVTWLDRYAAMTLFSGLDAAVSAGGYNTYHELMFVGVPTVFLPQPRIADDQAARVAVAVAAGAARLATTVDAVVGLLDAPGDPAAARALVPENGARRAAAEILSGVLPRDEVAHAVRVFPSSLLGSATARALDTTRLHEVIRLIGGESSAAWRSRRAVALDVLDAAGAPVTLPTHGPAGGEVPEFFAMCDALRVPADAAAAIVAALSRRWPAAGGDAMSSASRALLTALARFDDWPGAIALIRALPAQRTVSVGATVDAVAAWLATEHDLFDAQRALLRTEAGGQRSLVEVLRLLSQRSRAPEALL
jgi:UDP-N-acetylglucosamine--N-acetylmuramyl-(pentapeptide) pyrophosphoryl-undecaprenol N-acetylglucosamine transferase